MNIKLIAVLLTAALGTSHGMAFPAPEPREPHLELVLKPSKTQVKSDEKITWEVSIINRGKNEALFVQPGDGSDCGWRTPIIEWVMNGRVPGQLNKIIRDTRRVEGQPNKDFLGTHATPVLKPACLGKDFARDMRCGNISPLCPNEVIVLKPGLEIKLSEWSKGPRGLSAGLQKVAVRYFHIPDLKWRGIGGHDLQSMERIRASAAFTLESNAVEIIIAE